MESNKWRKIENEDGYPCYIDETTGKQQYDHPKFLEIVEKLKVYDGIKYGAYRIAFKIYELQKQLKVPALRISSGVFARHQLSLSESSLSLDTAELEAVLADIYFAAEKEGHFSGDVDITVDLMINLQLNVHDKDRKDPIRVLAAKTLLIILSEEPVTAKWGALANCAADHNGCVSPKRLAALLRHVTALATYLGSSCTQLQEDVDACFEKKAGMLGLPARAVAEWGSDSASTRWLAVEQRLVASRQMSIATVACSNCAKPLIQMLKFQCTKCNEVYFCEKCYLYDKGFAVPGHKKSHLVQEIIDGQSKPPQCLSFMRGMKRFFFCTKTKKRKTVKPGRQQAHAQGRESSRRPRRGEGARAGMVTSTVGKAEGHKETAPTAALQDIIHQLETQNKALHELSEQLKKTAVDDGHLKVKVDDHCAHISTQINRLKAFKDNLSSQTDLPRECNPERGERPQAFDLFSPIPVVAKQSEAVADKVTNQPRVLSLDSGNFSVVSKSGSQHLLTMSGDALRPVLQTEDTISTVSITDISCWYNEQDSLASDRRQRQPSSLKPAITLQGNPALPAAGPTDRTAAFSRSPTDRLSACDRVERGPGPVQDQPADLDAALDRLHQILTHYFDDSSFDNSQLRATAREIEGLLGALIRGVERRAAGGLL